MKWFVVVALLLVAGVAEAKELTAKKFVFVSHAINSGKMIAVRTTNKPNLFFWYIDKEKTIVKINSGCTSGVIYNRDGSTDDIFYDSDGDVQFQNGVYPEQSVVNRLFVESAKVLCK